VFENRVLRRIFGPKRDEVAGEWRKLNNEELHDLYSSPSIIRIIKRRSFNIYRSGGPGSIYNTNKTKSHSPLPSYRVSG
jgi:hypothetical protein